MHREITLHEAGRTYWKWVLYNPVEFAFFLGFPLEILAVVHTGCFLIYIFRRKIKKKDKNVIQCIIFETIKYIFGLRF